MIPIKIAMLGAGQHSLLNHLPSLKTFHVERRYEIELTGLCDIRLDAAEAAAKEFGFARAYSDFDEMLDRESPDAVIAVTPIAITCDIARNVVGRGLPLLMEKPLGASLDESREIVDFTQDAKVMVSLNRRFHPTIVAARKHLKDKSLRYIRATMLRVNRVEPDFMFGTAIHALDAVRSLAGDVVEHSAHIQLVDGVRWYAINLTFESGARGLIEVFPSAGVHGENYEAAGPGFHLRGHASELSPGRIRCVRNNEVEIDEVLNEDAPMFIRNGSYNETVAFIDALQGKTPFYPTPAQALQSSELCQAILDQAEQQTESSSGLT